MYKSNSKIDDIIIDVEKKLGDYVYGDYIQKDPCVDGKYDIIRENQGGGNNSGDGSCCGTCCCCSCLLLFSERVIRCGDVCNCGCGIVEHIFNCCCN